jgi:hypothetical protein
MSFPNPESSAYRKGFNDGYIKGEYNNPYDGAKTAIAQLQYKWGYDAGVATYCREKHSEDYDFDHA